MTRTSDNLLEHYAGAIEGSAGGWSSSKRNDAEENTIRGAGPFQFSSDTGGIITWPSNHTASESGQRSTAPAFAWLNRCFDRPCATPSPLNEF